MTKPIPGLRNKRIKDRCIIEKTIDNSDFKVADAFGVVGEQMAYVLLRGLSDVKSKDIIWICQKEVFSLNFHIYHLDAPEYDHYDKMSASQMIFDFLQLKCDILKLMKCFSPTEQSAT